MASGDDRRLVEESLRVPAAYGVLVERYEGQLRRYLRRLTGASAEDAEDLLQETFIKAYINLNDFDRTRALAPWLYRIAHNEAMNLLRKRRREPPVIHGADADLLMQRIAGELADPWTAGDRWKEVHAGLLGLAPRYREALVLRYLEEKSYRDIGDILRLPPGTVATLIRRGLDRLRTLVSAHDDTGNTGAE